MTSSTAIARPEKPTTPGAKPIAPSYAQVIRILNLVRTEADISAIETELKRDIAMSYRLLNYINSVGMNFPRQITSYRQAVTILGYQQLYRWLTLLLLTANPHPNTAPLVKASIVRGRFLENVSQLCTPKLPRDPLFIVGIFSALDKLFDQPMQLVLDSLRLSEEMNLALMERSGPYGSMLRLAEDLQTREQPQRAPLEVMLGLDKDAVDQAYLEAETWSGSILA